MTESSASPTVWALIESHAEDHPDSVLFSDAQGRQLTAASLRSLAEQAAAGLGVQPGQVVSWQLPNRIEAIVVMAALARVGAVQNPVIPILRERDVALITGQIHSEVLIVPEEWNRFSYGAMARGLDGPAGLQVIALELEDSDTELKLPLGDPTNLPPPPEDSHACRWYYFSSGTTGLPKGARHTDSSLIASSFSMTERLAIRDGDVYPIAWPITHIGGISMTSAVLRAGGRLALFDRFDPATFGNQAAAVRPTILGSGVPFFRACLDAQYRQGGESLYPELRACTAGGAPTPPELIREMSEVFGIPGVVNSWGMTEFPIATCPNPTDPPAKLAVSVGTAGPGVQIRIVDGEIRVKGQQCFLGYVDPSMDAEIFDEEGWLRTGDLAEVDPDGFVTITGRLKDIIIRNGENISPAELENLLMTHPSVRDVTVIGMPDPRTGERVCAVIVRGEGEYPTLENIRQFCLSQGLARQKAPEQLVVVPALERNPMGKIVKTELRDRLVREEAANEERVDEEEDESFPASDPHSDWAGSA